MTRRSWWMLAAGVGGLLLTLLINYHSYLGNFNLVPGDEGDTRLIVYILEHWFRVLQGQQSPLRLNMFYPDPFALGYADALFLYAIPYSLLRAIRLDYFTSYQIALALLTSFGYGTWLLLFRRVLKAGIGLAVVAAVMLSSLNSMQVQFDAGQTLAIVFWPALVVLLHSYGTSWGHHRKRALFSLAAFSVVLGLLFFTGYYAAWYFVFTAVVFAALTLGEAAWRLGARRAIDGVGTLIRERWVELGIGVLVLVIALIPFALTYGPLIQTNAGRSFDLVLSFTPTVRDLVNVSPQNMIWSPLLTKVGFAYGNREVQLGSPLLVLLLFVILYGREVWSRLHNETQASIDRSVLVLASTGILLFLLSVKVRGFSLWRLVYAAIPGASALRAEGRILMVIDMIIVVAVIYWLQKIIQSPRNRTTGSSAIVPTAIIGVLCVVLIAEEVNGTAFRLDKAGQLQFMASIEKPQPQCAAFYIVNPSQTDRPVGYYELDAMMTSMKIGAPTINGYSGISPDPVFEMLPSGVEYEYGIMNWLRANRSTKGICKLNYGSKSFTAVDVNAEYARDLQAVRDQFVGDYLAAFNGVRFFVRAGDDLSNLYPQYLEEHGYLDKSLGYQTGVAYHWIDDRLWIGTRACGKNECPAIGIVGTYVEVEQIVEGFGGKGVQVYFPLPEAYDPRHAISPDMRGELLIVFPSSAFTE